jgi:hypothetical protein
VPRRECFREPRKGEKMFCHQDEDGSIITLIQQMICGDSGGDRRPAKSNGGGGKPLGPKKEL